MALRPTDAAMSHCRTSVRTTSRNVLGSWSSNGIWLSREAYAMPLQGWTSRTSDASSTSATCTWLPWYASQWRLWSRHHPRRGRRHPRHSVLIGQADPHGEASSFAPLPELFSHHRRPSMADEVQRFCLCIRLRMGQSAQIVVDVGGLEYQSQRPTRQRTTTMDQTRQVATPTPGNGAQSGLRILAGRCVLPR